MADHMVTWKQLNGTEYWARFPSYDHAHRHLTDLINDANATSIVIAQAVEESTPWIAGQGDPCLWCGLEVFDGGDFLADVDYREECRGSNLHPMPRGHCTGFAPDTLGDDPDVCTSCLAHRSDHPVTNEGESA